MEEELFESELGDTLDLLDVFSEFDDAPIFVDSVRTFKDSGILTMNRGLIIKLSDKSVFRLIISKINTTDGQQRL